MPISPGTNLGPYQIVNALGAGGMGEVYRARDANLNRDVAIKILPAAFAHDAERAARFVREAQTLATLNHPHIAHVYGFDDTSAGRVLVMELVEGETLAEKIARSRGRLPLVDVLSIAQQIADGLEAAHERGIVHRDLKPANVKVRADGTVKVLDFGLAKAVDSATPNMTALTNSPTAISDATHAGVVLGTAAYMAPEQAAGKTVDKRADIWAFGCVLFEMLTGRPLFTGSSLTEILASVLRDAPPLDALPEHTPPRVRRLLFRCLQRDPRNRLRDIGDARLELQHDDAEPSQGRDRPKRITLTAVAAACAVFAALAASVAWVLKPSTAPPLRKLAFTFDTPNDVTICALAPDGTRVAYVTNNHLYVQPLDTLVARDLGPVPPDTGDLAWSSDSAELAFSSADGKIRKVAAAGGPLLVVADIPETRTLTGLAWRGQELVAAVWRSGLYRVPARSGTLTPWLDVKSGTEIDFHNLIALPDGRVAFATHARGTEYAVESFDGTTRSMLHPPTRVASIAYAAGYLLLAKADVDSGLWAMPLRGSDLNTNAAMLVASDVEWVNAAADGSLLYRTSVATNELFELVAVNRAGEQPRAIGEPSPVVASPTVSPNGHQLAVMRATYDRSGSSAGDFTINVREGDGSIWIHDLQRSQNLRLTTDNGDYAHPSWFPSGDRLLVTANVSKIDASSLAVITTEGASLQRTPVTGTYGQIAANGEMLFLVTRPGESRVRRTPASASQPDAVTSVFDPASEPRVRDFALSPSGKLLAFVEVNVGTAETLLLTRFPSAEGRWHVASAPGGEAMWISDAAIRWARQTNELFFAQTTARPSRARMMAVAVTEGARVELSAPRPLFETDARNLIAGFDVSPDGQTFYFRRRVARDSVPTRPRYVIVQNWPAEFGGIR